jgi:hypothetical protein
VWLFFESHLEDFSSVGVNACSRALLDICRSRVSTRALRIVSTSSRVSATWKKERRHAGLIVDTKSDDRNFF